MDELYETLKSIMSEAAGSGAHTPGQARVEKITVGLDSKGNLTIQADWSDDFHTRIQLQEADVRDVNAEFFVKTRLRKQRRDNEGANQ